LAVNELASAGPGSRISAIVYAPENYSFNQWNMTKKPKTFPRNKRAGSRANPWTSTTLESPNEPQIEGTNGMVSSAPLNSLLTKLSPDSALESLFDLEMEKELLKERNTSEGVALLNTPMLESDPTQLKSFASDSEETFDSSMEPAVSGAAAINALEVELSQEASHIHKFPNHFRSAFQAFSLITEQSEEFKSSVPANVLNAVCQLDCSWLFLDLT
jgi:hypothetical protein